MLNLNRFLYDYKNSNYHNNIFSETFAAHQLISHSTQFEKHYSMLFTLFFHLTKPTLSFKFQEKNSFSKFAEALKLQINLKVLKQLRSSRFFRFQTV